MSIANSLGYASSKIKSEVFKVFHEFQTLAERLFNHKIITMQTDLGGEYERLNSFFH